MMRKIKILILEDISDDCYDPEPYNYIENIKSIKDTMKDSDIEVEAVTKKSEFIELDSKILKQAFDIAILDYSLGYFGIEETGWIYMEKILAKNPYCNIVLVTALNTIQKDINKLPENLQALISVNPNVKYIPKSTDFTSQIVNYVEEMINNLKARWKLQEQIIDCAIAAYKEFMGKEIGSLIEKPDKEIPGKEDTMVLDTITEEEIRKMFVPLIHKHRIVVCTEEGGVENKVIYRVDRPIFYIFSDPLDGSSAMKWWINETSISLEDLHDFTIPSALSGFCEIDNKSRSIIFKLSSEFDKYKDILVKANVSKSDLFKEWKNLIDLLETKITEKMNKTLKEIVQEIDEIRKWEERYGPIKLNSPMISIVLTERHHVVGNVLVNLFTGDIYKSVDSGNFRSRIDQSTFELAEDWKELRFRDFSDEFDKLLICTLQSVKHKKFKQKKEGKPQDFQYLMHFRECIQPLVPYDYNLEKSFEKRGQRLDFTPGPGRILYLTKVAEEYSSQVEDDEKELYSCILSSGEPLTEWVGWFAFLRHTKNLSAYCLRTGDGNICQHRIQRSNIKGTMIPPEVASLFKSGMMDFEVLHTGYRDAMQNYTDSIVVFFNNDESWKKIFERKLDERMSDTFTQIVT